MAERRMFTKRITDADEFTVMPPTAQCLYFHLCMGADDDGFSNNIRIAMFNAHATTDDFNTLVRRRFIIPFESGVIVIKHWKMHNYIQNDRYHQTKYIEERAHLVLKDNGVYTERPEGDVSSLYPDCIQSVSKMEAEASIGKTRLDKDSLEENIPPYNPPTGEDEPPAPTPKRRAKRFVKPTVDEIRAYCLERGNGIDAERFYDFYESKGWVVGKSPMKDWKAAIRTWEQKRGFKAQPKSASQKPTEDTDTEAKYKSLCKDFGFLDENGGIFTFEAIDNIDRFPDDVQEWMRRRYRVPS